MILLGLSACHAAPNPGAAASERSAVILPSAPSDPRAAPAARAATRGRTTPESLAPVGLFPTPPPAQVADPTLRLPTDWQGDDSVAGNRRAEAAELHKGPAVRAMFAEAGVAYPPKQLLWRVFKDTQDLEVWANDDKDAPMKKVATYRACAMSGDLGPKRREGDRQVPEGFYDIAYFFPDSAFHLAAKVSYPNGLDRALGDKVAPGGDIMIHGGCASIGCIALTDERIEELWVIGSGVLYKGEPIRVHIFPSRDLDGLIADDAWARHREFWENLREGYRAFEADRRPPKVKLGFHGKYEFPSPAG